MNYVQNDYLMHYVKMLSLAMKECLTCTDQVLRVAVTSDELETVKNYLVKNRWHWDVDDLQENSVEFRFSFADVRILMYNRERY
tara:strand:- start:13 stop:264 length:252 start_codon:yes stop_codon:yes gene_type:complete